MKKTNIIITLLIVCAIFNSNATTVIIQAIGNSSANELFSPQIAQAECGDTIRWVLVSGTHTTASTTIPAGATPWASGNITVSGFIYVVSVPGTYNYTCHPASGGHMDASIVVTCATDVPILNTENNYTVFPNPSSGKITIDTKENAAGSFLVYNSIGEKLLQTQLSTTITETYIDLPKGIYYYELISDSKIIGKGNLVIQK